MRLMQIKQAARVAGVSYGAVHYWVRTGRIKKHPMPLAELTKKIKPHLGEYSKRNYLIDVDELLAKRPAGTQEALRRSNPDLRLLTVREIANILNVETFTVRHYARRFELKHYYYGYSNEFLIDGDELADAMEDNGLGYLVR